MGDPGLTSQSFYDFASSSDGFLQTYADELYKLGVTSRSLLRDNILPQLISSGIPEIPASDIVDSFRSKFGRGPVAIFWDYESVPMDTRTTTIVRSISAVRNRIGIFGQIKTLNIYVPLGDISDQHGIGLQDAGAQIITVPKIVKRGEQQAFADKPMIVDALVFAYQHRGQNPVVCIVSKDADFAPLLAKLQMIGARSIMVTTDDAQQRPVSGAASVLLSWPSSFQDYISAPNAEEQSKMYYQGDGGYGGGYGGGAGGGGGARARTTSAKSRPAPLTMPAPNSIQHPEQQQQQQRPSSSTVPASGNRQESPSSPNKSKNNRTSPGAKTVSPGKRNSTLEPPTYSKTLDDQRQGKQYSLLQKPANDGSPKNNNNNNNNNTNNNNTNVADDSKNRTTSPTSAGNFVRLSSQQQWTTSNVRDLTRLVPLLSTDQVLRGTKRTSRGPRYTGSVRSFASSNTAPPSSSGGTLVPPPSVTVTAASPKQQGPGDSPTSTKTDKPSNGSPKHTDEPTMETTSSFVINDDDDEHGASSNIINNSYDAVQVQSPMSATMGPGGAPPQAGGTTNNDGNDDDDDNDQEEMGGTRDIDTLISILHGLFAIFGSGEISRSQVAVEVKNVLGNIDFAALVERARCLGRVETGGSGPEAWIALPSSSHPAQGCRQGNDNKNQQNGAATAGPSSAATTQDVASSNNNNNLNPLQEVVPIGSSSSALASAGARAHSADLPEGEGLEFWMSFRLRPTAPGASAIFEYPPESLPRGIELMERTDRVDGEEFKVRAFGPFSTKDECKAFFTHAFGKVKLAFKPRYFKFRPVI